jgi:hypothetical protein
MATETGLVALFPKRFFGQIKKTATTELLSEYLGPVSTAVYQPFVVNASNCLTGFTMTMFTKIGVNYQRTATTIPDLAGNYAIDSFLATTIIDATGNVVPNPAYVRLQLGAPFQGQATIYGRLYQTNYIPIFQPGTTGAANVIGAFFIGYKLYASDAPAPQVISRANVNLLTSLTGPCHTVVASDQIVSGARDREYTVSVFQGYLKEPNLNLNPLIPKTNFVNEMFQQVLVNLNRPLATSNTLFVLVKNYDAAGNYIDTDFIRCATTLLDDFNNYALNTKLSRESPAYSKLLAGQGYEGIVILYGYNYYAVYEPILDDFTGAVIGAYFSGYFC